MYLYMFPAIHPEDDRSCPAETKTKNMPEWDPTIRQTQWKSRRRRKKKKSDPKKPSPDT
jgi:hypothetical protein